MNKKNTPSGRKDNIVIQEVNGEILIYDLDKNKAFCLNETSAKVWQACNGKKTVAEIAASVGNEDLVWLALDQFKKEDLLEVGDGAENVFSGMSRREIIKKVGYGSIVALPVITMLVAPKAVMASSVCGSVCQNDRDCPNPSCNQCRQDTSGQGRICAV